MAPRPGRTGLLHLLGGDQRSVVRVRVSQGSRLPDLGLQERHPRLEFLGRLGVVMPLPFADAAETVLRKFGLSELLDSFGQFRRSLNDPFLWCGHDRSIAHRV